MTASFPGEPHDGGLDQQAQFGQDGPEGQPSEAELRAAYEAQLSRITSADVILQTIVTLLNLGGRRLGFGAPAGAADAERDLDQARDAVEGVRALLPIVERMAPEELRPLREALSQLQLAYARETQGAAGTAAQAGAHAHADADAHAHADANAEAAPTAAATPAPGAGSQAAGGQQPAPSAPASGDDPNEPDKPGPAESSGRLWVPGR
ncbi:MAG TPA: hypothetical protein VLJ42_05130 [Solirubrobacteraceae bacterium]|nr:hypothetical protein [Solirubrobacteraceae bacterium]